MELITGLHCLVRLVQQLLNILQRPRSFLNVILVLVSLLLLQLLNLLLQRLNLSVVVVGHYAVLSDPELDGFDKVAKCLGAEKEDVATRCAGVCVGVVNVKALVWWEEDMANRDEQDNLAITAFAKVETSSTFIVRSGLGSDGESECCTRTLHLCPGQ